MQAAVGRHWQDGPQSKALHGLQGNQRGRVAAGAAAARQRCLCLLSTGVGRLACCTGNTEKALDMKDNSLCESRRLCFMSK